ncbi:hypothetical protein ES705_48645 [subsurface metagenome]
MVGLVVNDDNVSLVPQFPADTTNHLVWCLSKRISCALCKNTLGEFTSFHELTPLKGMKISNNDFGLSEFCHPLSWKDITLLIIILRVVGQQNTQTITDSNPRCDD